MFYGYDEWREGGRQKKGERVGRLAPCVEVRILFWIGVARALGLRLRLPWFPELQYQASYLRDGESVRERKCTVLKG